MSRTSILVGILVVALLALLVPSAASATVLPEKITENTTLTAAGSPYTGSSVTIESGATVNAEPGVVVKVSGLDVNGTLKAEGTAEEPVLFTSAADSGAGQWAGIDFNPGSGGVIDHAELRYAGSGTGNPTIQIEESSPTITHSTIRDGDNTGIAVDGGGSPEIAFNSVLDHASTGINYNAGSGDTGTIDIHDNLVDGNNRGIFLLTSISSVSATSLGGNTIKNSSSTTAGAIYCSVFDVPPDLDENTLIANADNHIGLSGTLNQSATWTDHGYPIVAENGGFAIAKSTALTVGPGMTFKGISPEVNGTLKAEGTAEKPILFTSVADSAAGQWGGIDFNSGSSGVIDHAELRYAGSGTNSQTIRIEKASPTITNSTIRNGSSTGISVHSGGSPEIAHNAVLNNTFSTAISYNAGSGDTGTINIHDNVIENNDRGIFLLTSISSVSATSLGGNTIKNSSSTTAGAIYCSVADVPADLDENTLSGNAKNYIGLSGTLSQSATWTDHGYPIVAENGNFAIAKSTTLTIGPGMTFKGIGASVNGTLKAEGTAEKPILFTSISDSAAGQWGGIDFNPGSSGVIDHAELRYAGSGTNSQTIRIDEASPTITNSTIRNGSSAGISLEGGGSPEIAYNSIRNNTSSTAISYNAGSGDTGTIDIHDNLIENNNRGIFLSTSSSSVSATSLSGNTIKNSSSTTAGAIYCSVFDVPPDLDENTLSGNAKNYIGLSGTLNQSATWTDHGYPIVAENGGFAIAKGATLTAGPGMVFKGISPAVNGTLKAEGTAEKPILFTSNSDSGAGQWGGIDFNSGSSGVIDHAELRYAGSGTNSQTIRIEKASPTITNSTIRNGSSTGISVSGGGSPEIAHNAVLNNTFSTAINYNAGSGDTGTINIHDNLIENNDRGIFLTTGTSSVSATSVGDNTIKNSSSTTAGAIYCSVADVPPDLDENTLSGNARNYIGLSGTLNQSASWTDHGYPIVAENGNFAIAKSATLTAGPGMVFKGIAPAVSGTLKAEGTAEKPILFTSVADSGAGQWTGIKFEAGSGPSVIDHAELRYAGSGTNGFAIKITGVSPSITHSSIRNNSKGGIKVTSSGKPTIRWTSFTGNSFGLSYEGTGTIQAPNNYWGCASGPAPAGCGNSVSGNVEWKPQAEIDTAPGHCQGKETQCGVGADPVSLATGYLTYSHRDILLTNKSRVPLEFTRAYNSGDPSDSGLGPGWSQTGLANATELENGDVLVRRQDGRQDVFVKAGASYVPPSGVTDSLVKNEDGTFTLTTLDRTVHRFDSSGRIASITDDHGLKTTYAYDANGRLATITDPSSQTLTFAYNGSHHITSVKDSTGREVKYTYSGAGDLATVTDALGGVTEYTYDALHRLKTIKDPRGNVILKNTYDGQGRIIEQRDGLENLWKLEYKKDETIVTEPEGGKITYGLDAQNRVISEKDQLGNTTTTSYDAAGNVDEIVKPGGAKWQFGHDGDGNLTSVIDPEEGERSYEYDGKNRLTEFTDEREETWTYEWDEDNDLKKIADPVEGETTFTHDAAGLPLTVTDPNENTTTFTYDTRGNRLTAEDAFEHTTTLAYNTRNQLTSKTAPGLAAETYGRNALGDLLSVTTPEGHKTEYAYDANGMRTKVTDPAEGVWEIKRDAMERPTAYVDPLGKETKVEYDGNLNPVKITDRRGQATTYAYDLANQRTEIVRPEGGDWEFGYDARGNRIEAVDPRENATTYEFDLLDRITEAAEPLEAATSYEYDPAGNLIAFTDPRENTTELAYDELGRLTEIDQPLEKTTSFTYDPVGNQLTQTTAAGTIDFGYDAANRLEEISEGETALRSYEYDAANRMIGATDAQADQIEIGYDDDGRVVSIDDGRGQTVVRKFDSRGNLIEQTDGRGVLAYEYDKLSRMIELTDPQSKVLEFDHDAEGNFTKVELPNGVITTNEFDNAGRLAETTSAKGEATLESLEYEYDPFGNRIGQVDRLSRETSYEYDALNRLIEFDPPGEGSTSYDYDPAGNRTKAGAVTYGFNDLDQLTSASNGTTYDYDDAGRLIEVDQGETSTTYGWSVLDELTSADTGAKEIDYAYDAFGRQVLRDDGSTIRPSHYGDLSDLPILDTDAEGEPTMSYVQGPEGLVEQRSGEATSFPLRDAHGDITTLADGEGEVVSRQTYDPWGAQLTGPSLEMGWLGAQQRRTDLEVGLSQMGVRTYAFDQGAFLSEDPMLGRYGKGQSLNRYAYVQGNPINYFDLDGRITIEIPGTPIELHPMLPTPGNPIPELPVTIDGVPSLPELINNQIPNLPFEDNIQDRANAFIKDKGGELALGCLGGGLGGLGVLNAMSGGAPIFIPGIGWVTELGAAGLGCGIGAAGNSVLGINPVRTR
jgi:RHS repeat-associated protein